MNAPTRKKGRGATSNASGRFEPHQREQFDDGWQSLEEFRESTVRTQITPEKTRNIITRNDSPDVPFDSSINPYKGCEHGCIYCFARPTHAYLGLSPGLDFETKIISKPDAPERLREAFAKPSYRCETLALGANTDPYQPAERRFRITRRLLEVLWEQRHPVAIITKSDLVLRDLDVLSTMAQHNLVAVMLSITTLSRQLASRLEPRAAIPQRRLRALQELSQNGVPTGVLASPIIPAINDMELEQILDAAKQAGAQYAGYILVRLPHEVKELFDEWLQTHFPERRGRVLNIIRDTRDGDLYNPQFGTRMRGSGAYAELLAQRFTKARRRLDLSNKPFVLDTSQFIGGSASTRQLKLF